MVTSKFGLAAWALGRHVFLEVAQAEALALKAAVADLAEAVSIEQKFDLVMSNFVELETEVVERSINMMYRGWQAHEDLLDDRLAFARRLLNVLSATRLYVDHVKHHTGRLYPNDDTVADDVKKLFSARYDASFAYRVMDALRNYSQHRGMPIHGFSYDQNWIKDDDRVEANVSFSVDVDTLALDGRFKTSVLNEMKQLSSQIDLKPLTREYIEQLGAAHLALRALITPRIDAAASLLRGANERYESHAGPDRLTGIAVVEERSDGTREKLSGLATTAIEYLARLKGRNSRLANLSRQTLATKTIPTKKQRGTAL